MSYGYGEKSEDSKSDGERINGRDTIIRFGERLKDAMNGMSNVELARRSGLSETTIRKYLSGKIYPGIDNLAAVADACNVSMTWLLTGDSDESNKDVDQKIEASDVEQKVSAPIEANNTSQMLMMLLQRLSLSDQEAVADVLIRKGVETLLQLTDEENIELLNLNHEIKELALILKSLPSQRTREICESFRGDKCAVPLTDQSVKKML